MHEEMKELQDKFEDQRRVIEHLEDKIGGFEEKQAVTEDNWRILEKLWEDGVIDKDGNLL